MAKYIIDVLNTQHDVVQSWGIDPESVKQLKTDCYSTLKVPNSRNGDHYLYDRTRPVQGGNRIGLRQERCHRP